MAAPVNAALPKSDLATFVSALAAFLNGFVTAFTSFPAKYPCLGCKDAIPPPAKLP